MSSRRALGDQLAAPLRLVASTLLRIANPRAAQRHIPAKSGDVTEVFARAKPGRVSLTESYRFEQAISVNPSITPTERSGRIEVIVPYDGDKCFPRRAIEDLEHQIGKSSEDRSTGNDETSALIGHLALTNIKMANLPDGSPLATRHGAIPLRLPVRSSRVDDEVLTFDEQEAVLRTDYVPDALEHYPIPLKVMAEVFDPEDGEGRPARPTTATFAISSVNPPSRLSCDSVFRYSCGGPDATARPCRMRALSGSR